MATTETNKKKTNATREYDFEIDARQCGHYVKAMNDVYMNNVQLIDHGINKLTK